MHSIVRTLAGCALLCATTARADALSTFGTPGSHVVLAPAGLAPSFLFGSAGTDGYLFIGAVPGTMLVGSSGSELCGIASFTRCAFADLFSGGVRLANVVQGVLAAAGDTFRTFELVAAFANGDRLTGSVTIDTTIGFVLDKRATLFSGGVVDTFYNPLGQNPFSPAGLAPSYLFQSIGANGVLLNIATPGGSLIDYGGGDICATSTALNCAFSNIFVGSPIASNAVSGRLTLRAPAAVPEAESWAFVLILTSGLASASFTGFRSSRRTPTATCRTCA